MNSFNYAKTFLTCLILSTTQCSFTSHATVNNIKNRCSKIQYKDDDFEKLLQEALDATPDIPLKQEAHENFEHLKIVNAQALLDRGISYKNFCTELDTIIQTIHNHANILNQRAQEAVNSPMQHDYTSAAQKYKFIANNLDVIKNLFKKLKQKHTSYVNSNIKAIKYAIYVKDVYNFKEELNQKTGNKFLLQRFISLYNTLSSKKQLDTFIPTLNSLFEK